MKIKHKAFLVAEFMMIFQGILIYFKPTIFNLIALPLGFAVGYCIAWLNTGRYLIKSNISKK